jgi:threonine dehydrogenase-like Zn-dependent dehydrogenase
VGEHEQRFHTVSRVQASGLLVQRRLAMKALVYHGPGRATVTDSLVTHRFRLDDILRAYDTFANAAEEKALKVVLTGG